MPKLKMVKTASGPDGNYIIGRCYVVPPKVHESLCGGDDPAALDYEAAAELASEGRGEIPEKWEAPRQPQEIEPPEPKDKPKRRAQRR